MCCGGGAENNSFNERRLILSFLRKFRVISIQCVKLSKLISDTTISISQRTVGGGGKFQKLLKVCFGWQKVMLCMMEGLCRHLCKV